MTTLGAGFGVENLPFGVARLPDGLARCVSALYGSILDLSPLAGDGLLAVPGLVHGVLEDPSLNRFLACGRPVWDGVRQRLAALVRDGHPVLREVAVAPDEVELLAPVAVGDFVDFSASIHHATNVGRLFRPGAEPLSPSWRHMPRGYSGRASSVVAAGRGVTRPVGVLPAPGGQAAVQPTAALDFEAEVGLVLGGATRHGERVPAGCFRDHAAGLVLVNDWSARDVQAYESHPLGPFLGKSFATSVSPWLVSLDALEPYRVAAPAQQPPPPPHLATTGDTGYDLRLEVTLQSEEMRRRAMAPVTVVRTSFAGMYWTLPQLLAHATLNGAAVRPGDLLGSGTVSGHDPGSEACLLELTWGGSRPVPLPDGTSRGYLEDGDTVTVRGWAGGDGRPLISLGEVTGTVLPARPLEV